MTSESPTRFPQFFAGMAVIAVSLILSAWIAGQSVQRFKAADNTISVVGAATKPIQADLGVWRSSLSVENTSMKDGLASLQSAMAQVRDYLVTEKQVPADAVSVGALESEPLPELLANGNPSGKTRAYRLTQTLEVKLSDVKRIETLAQESSELIMRGLPFESRAPEYLYTKLADLRVTMLAEATQDARTRAEQIVKSAGSQLGPVRSVRTGVFQITRPNSTEASDYGSYDTGTIAKEITAVLTMTFAVE
ncbi:MAG: SIMPL domain-containing protein [Candidatus Sericytochromatia bacterium]